MANKKGEKKQNDEAPGIDIGKMSYAEIMNLLKHNQEVNVNAGVLLVTLRRLEERLIDVYGLKPKKKIIVPDNSIKDLNGNKL